MQGERRSRTPRIRAKGTKKANCHANETVPPTGRESLPCKKMGQPQCSGSPAAAVKLGWNASGLPTQRTVRMCRVPGKHHGIAFMTQDAGVLLSPSRSRPPQCPHAHSNGSKSRKNRSHLIPTLIPTLLIKEGRAARGSGTRDPDQRRSLPHWGSQRTCCVRANLHMYHAPCAVLRYSGLLFGTGQRIAWLACSGARTEKQQGRPRR